MDGPADVTEVCSDFRDVDGPKVNFASVQRAGESRSPLPLTDVKINSGDGLPLSVGARHTRDSEAGMVKAPPPKQKAISAALWLEQSNQGYLRSRHMGALLS